MTLTSYRVAIAACVLLLTCGFLRGQEKQEPADLKTLQQRALEALKASKAGDPARKEEAGESATPPPPPPAPAKAAPTPASKSDLPSFSEIAPKPATPKEEPKPGPKPLPARETKVIRVEPDGPKPPPPPARPAKSAQPDAQGGPKSEVRNPQSTSYKVQAGDTFRSIAAKLYGDEGRWIHIAKANPLVDPVHLKVGQELRLPDVSAQSKEREQELQKVQREVSSGSAPQTVTVEPHDTLGGIAQRVYGRAALWKVLFEANKDQLDEPDHLKVGMKLKVPPKPGSKPAAAPAPPPAKPAAPAPVVTPPANQPPQ